MAVLLYTYTHKHTIVQTQGPVKIFHQPHLTCTVQATNPFLHFEFWRHPKFYLYALLFACLLYTEVIMCRVLATHCFCSVQTMGGTKLLWILWPCMTQPSSAYVYHFCDSEPGTSKNLRQLWISVWYPNEQTQGETRHDPAQTESWVLKNIGLTLIEALALRAMALMFSPLTPMMAPTDSLGTYM